MAESWEKELTEHEARTWEDIKKLTQSAYEKATSGLKFMPDGSPKPEKPSHFYKERYKKGVGRQAVIGD